MTPFYGMYMSVAVGNRASAIDDCGLLFEILPTPFMPTPFRVPGIKMRDTHMDVSSIAKGMVL